MTSEEERLIAKLLTRRKPSAKGRPEDDVTTQKIDLLAVSTMRRNGAREPED